MNHDTTFTLTHDDDFAQARLGKLTEDSKKQANMTHGGSLS